MEATGPTNCDHILSFRHVRLITQHVGVSKGIAGQARNDGKG